MNQIVDQISMLLSADWFLGHWELFGLQSGPLARETMKEKCRIIVRQIYNGESDYWMVSFEEVRLQVTREAFFSAINESHLHSADAKFLRQLVDRTQGEIKDADSVSLMHSLTQLLISDTSDEVVKKLPPELVKTVAILFSVAGDDINLVSLSLDSQTEWDSGLRKMTPGLPEYLADFALTIYEQTHSFVRFWAKVVASTSLDERKELLDWYQETALELTTRNLELPQIVM